MWRANGPQFGADEVGLSGAWRLAKVAPGAVVLPSGLSGIGDLHWLQLPALVPVAQALEALGPGATAQTSGSLDADDWWYQLRLPSGTGAAPGLEHILSWASLAGPAELWLDDERLADSVSMFLPGQVSLGASARWAGRTLSLVFRSLDEALKAKRPRPSWKAPMVANQQIRWWRTPLLGRTPAWTPAVPPIGPCGPMLLASTPRLDLADWWVRGEWRADQAWLEAGGVLTLVPHAGLQGQVAVRLLVQVDGQALACPAVLTPLTDADGGADRRWRVSVSAPVPGAGAWWPHTHGEPTCHAIELEVCEAEGAVQRLALAPVGFRHVHIDTHDGDFHLHVNGRSVFARGVVLLPPEPARWDLDLAEWRAVLLPYVEAGLNMLRIPGTMCYGSDAFYRCCDQLGLMVWQDFMFANMDYPGEDAIFLGLVQQEVRVHARRLMGHASLVVWCGNSEVSQQALMFAAPRQRWYPALFHERMPAWLAELGVNVPYWPSSVSGGSLPCQADQGTTSYYGVGVYMRPLEDARRSRLRFATECLGVANEPWLPRQGGWEPNHQAIGGNFMAVQDHYMAQLFKVDPVALAETDPARHRDLSQATSAVLMASSFEEWRRHGSGCRGGLIWFGRDIQPGAGFGILDHQGHPKAAYYAVKRSFRPRALSFSDEGGNGLFLHAVNETAAPAQGQVELTLYKADGSRIDGGRLPLQVEAWSTRTLAAGDAFDWFLDLSYAYRFGPPSIHVVVARWFDGDGVLQAEGFGLPAGLDLPAQDSVGWQVEVLPGANESGLVLQLQAQRFAQFVRIEAPGWESDDNLFHLEPGVARRVFLRAASDALSSRAQVRALNTLEVLDVALDQGAA
jgi:beta-mannosidase